MTPRGLARLLPGWVRSPALRLLRRSRRLTQLVAEPEPVQAGYAAWLASQPHTGRVTSGAEDGPTFSIVMPVYDTPEPLLRAAIGSVLRQGWTRWQLCIADDASPAPHVRRVLEEYAALDPRIRVTRRAENGHIAAASNTALASATGEWVALLDHDDLLPPEALAEVAAAIARHPSAALVFTDEDKIDAAGARFDPYLKPGFDPDLLLGQNLVNHLAVYRRGLLAEIGGWREGFEGSQDYDLALRAIDAAGPDAVIHLPRILYHWRQSEGGGSFSQTALERCAEAGRRAVAGHLHRRGVIGAVVEPSPRLRFWNRIRWPLPRCEVSLVLLPGADPARSLDCARRLVAATAHPVAEIIVALAQDGLPDAPPPTRAAILPCGAGAGWARRVNRAVAAARGDVVVLAGDRPAVADAEWLTELVAQLGRAEIGAVAGVSLDGSGRVRQAEIALDAEGSLLRAYAGARHGDAGYLGGLALVRRVGALGGAYMAFRRAAFRDAGGADEAALDGGLADADLCFRLRRQGLGVLFTPHAPLVDGGAPVGTPDGVAPAVAAAFAARWLEDGARDPARSPLLGLLDGRPAWRAAGAAGG